MRSCKILSPLSGLHIYVCKTACRIKALIGGGGGGKSSFMDEALKKNASFGVLGNDSISYLVMN